MSRSMTPAEAAIISDALREVLPSDRFVVQSQPGMGYDGVLVAEVDGEHTWYFDTTYGGDDGYTDELRIYLNIGHGADVRCDDIHPLGPVLATATPVEIARWVASVVTP